MDPMLYENPTEFDGLRFHNLGQVSGKPNNYKLSGASPKTRQFGDGRHTWYVSNQLFSFFPLWNH